MILLVVPLGFSTGTELLKTSAHSSHTDFPMVNFDPPDSDGRRDTVLEKQPAHTQLQLMSVNAQHVQSRKSSAPPKLSLTIF